jgi:outer membrane protein OmpA-like peptidoglycan-associated protein
MKSKFIFLLIAGCLVCPEITYSQFNIRRRVERAVNRSIDKKVDKSIDKAIDNALNKEKKTNEKDSIEATEREEEVIEKATSDMSTVSLKSFSKYDFVPGDKVILFEDFSQDAVGDFPALWTTDAAGEVNTLNVASGNWFNLNSGEGTYWFMNEIDFPQNFILEMDIVPKVQGGRFAADVVFFGEKKHSEMDKNGDPGNCGLHVQIQKNEWGTIGYKTGETNKLTGSSTINPVQAEMVNHVILWIQKRRVRIYHQGAKVLDMPTNIYEGSKFNRMCFKLYRGASAGSYISNIKITNAAPDTRSKLLTEGKLVTYGIYFDVNKDVVKPESYGTLKEIAAVLNEVQDVKVKIVGHTDADGPDAVNLDLSKRRAAAVKGELAKSFGVNADQLETDGLGEKQPVAPNNTPVNKAQNRRVEFIKL